MVYFAPVMDFKSKIQAAQRKAAPYVRPIARPALYGAIGASAILGLQHRETIADTVDPKPETVRGTLVSPVKPYDEVPNQLDTNVDQIIHAGFSVTIRNCDDLTDDLDECFEHKIFITENDVAENKVKREGNDFIVTEDIIERGTDRPSTIIHRER